MVKQTFFNLPEEKRQRIIDVALDEFASRPYSKASLSNIVSRAGIAKGSMYQYFKDKKALYTFLLEHAAEEKLAYIKSVEIGKDGDFFEVFEKVMLAGVRFNLEHPKLGKIIANAMEPLGDGVVQDFAAFGKRMSQNYFEQMLLQAQQQGTVRLDIDAKLVSHLLTGMFNDGLVGYMLEPTGLTTREFIGDHDKVKKILEDKIDEIIRTVINFLRNGLQVKG